MAPSRIPLSQQQHLSDIPLTRNNSQPSTDEFYRENPKWQPAFLGPHVSATSSFPVGSTDCASTVDIAETMTTNRELRMRTLELRNMELKSILVDTQIKLERSELNRVELESLCLTGSTAARTANLKELAAKRVEAGGELPTEGRFNRPQVRVVQIHKKIKGVKVTPPQR